MNYNKRESKVIHKTKPNKQLNVVLSGESTRTDKVKPVHARNRNPNKIRKNLFAKNKVVYDYYKDCYVKTGYNNLGFCTRCGHRCMSSDGYPKNYSHKRRQAISFSL